MDRPTLEVADIFRRDGDVSCEEAGPSLSTAQRRVMTAIETCRTAALGGHVEQCDTGGERRRISGPGGRGQRIRQDELVLGMMDREYGARCRPNHDDGQQDASPDEEHMKPLEMLYLVSWYSSSTRPRHGEP